MRNNSICRRLLVFCILSFISYNTLAGERYSFVHLKNFHTGKPSLDNQIKTSIDLPYIYYFTEEEWDSDARRLKIFRAQLETNYLDSFTIQIPKSIVIYELPEICVTGSFLILTDDERCNHYRYIKSGNTFEFKNEIKTPKNYARLNVAYIDNSKFFLSSIYNHYPEKGMHKAHLAIYDAAANKITAVLHPDLPCIGFTHLIGSWETYNKNTIAVADPCGYSIKFYDFNLRLIDSIKWKGDRGWTDPPGNKIPVETEPDKVHPKVLIDQLLLMQDTVSRIEKIFFLNDSMLLVSSMGRGLNKEKKRLDIWNIKDKSAPIYTNASMPVTFNAVEKIDLADCPLMLNRNAGITMKENHIYITNEEDFFPSVNMSLKQFEVEKETYYEKHDPYFTISIYKIVLR